MSIVCSICHQDILTEGPRNLDEGDGDSELITTKCGHLYHLQCIENWFSTKNCLPNQCPICSKVVHREDYLTIFPSGDDESGDVAAKLSKAKAAVTESRELKDELAQINMILEETGESLENEKLSHEILKYEYAQTISELEELRRERNEQQKVVETTEKNWLEIVEKMASERNEAMEKVVCLEKRLELHKVESEKRYQQKLDDLKLIADFLEERNEALSKEIEETKLQQRDIALLEKQMNGHNRSDISTQTEHKDLENIKSRLCMFKTCIGHLETEAKLLEEECRNQQPEGHTESESTHTDKTFISGDDKVLLKKCTVPLGCDPLAESHPQIHSDPISQIDSLALPNPLKFASTGVDDENSLASGDWYPAMDCPYLTLGEQ